MRIFNLLAGSLLASSVLAAPHPRQRLHRSDMGYTEVQKMSPENIRISVTKDNTLNGTVHLKTPQVVSFKAQTSSISLPISFVNNLNNGLPVHAYITGIDKVGRVAFVKSNGQFYYPSSAGSQVPVPIDNSISIPINPRGANPSRISILSPLISARIYFSAGDELQFFVVSTPNGDGIVQPSAANLQDPNTDVQWGFMELTFNTDGSVFTNPSMVDFVGLPLSLSLEDNVSDTVTVTRSLGPNALSDICSGLARQATIDGKPWNRLCLAKDGIILRALSPNLWTSIDPDAFSGYYDAYVDKVWETYTPSNPLRVDTQRGDIGTINCSAEGEVFVCDGSDKTFPKPSARDIFGCNSGPFALDGNPSEPRKAFVPRFCAAFSRTTLLIDGGDIQPGPPPSEYYTESPSNHYSRLVHESQSDGKGYAFPYDDVTPNGAPDASGSLASSKPGQLTIFIGGSG